MKPSTTTWTLRTTLAILAIAGASAASAENALLVREAELRAGPGFGRKTLGAVPSGATLEILEERTGWVRVALQGGREGWLRDHVIERPARGASLPHALPPTAGEAGDAAAPRAESASWTSRDGDGWPVSGDPSAGDAATTPEAGTAGSWVGPAAAARTLYLRPEPTFDVALVGRIPVSAPYAVLVEDGEWTQVQADDGLTGWVRTEALAPPLGVMAHASVDVALR